MIHLGLIGYPLDHSLSPLLHHAALQSTGLQGEYTLYPVHPAGTAALQDLVRRVREEEIQGLNITIPYKRAIVRLVDQLTPAAKAIGAVNTIYLRAGRVVGDNTDFAAFLADLQTWGLRPRSSMVLGAGGAARAVVYALGTTGCSLTLASRQPHQARELAQQAHVVKAVPLSYEALRGMNADLVVNATAAGMYPHVNESAWPAGLPLPQGAALYDLVYNPPETRLMQQAQTAGLQTRNGLGMLIEQAILAFELWTEQTPSRPELEQAVGYAAG